MAHADVTETIEHALIGKDAVSCDQVLQQPSIAGGRGRRGRLRRGRPGERDAGKQSGQAAKRSAAGSDGHGVTLGCRKSGLERCG